MSQPHSRIAAAAVAPALVLAALLAPAMAQSSPEANARAAVKALAPTMTIESVAAAPLPGFQEVVVGSQVIYVSNDGRYLIEGAVLDTRTRENLTEVRKVKARRAALAKVGPDQRISFPAKNEKYRLTVFTDIDCGWCRKMHQQMAEYNNAGITVDYLFFPRAGLQGDSYKQAVAVWCAKDRRAAMTQAKAGTPLPASECKNPVADQFNLGMQLGVAGTPTIYSSGGVDMRGYKPPQDMATALAALGQSTAPAKAAAGGGSR